MRNGRMAYGRVLLPDAILGLDADRHQRDELEMRASIAVENDHPAHRARIAGAVKSAGAVPVDTQRRSMASLRGPFPYPTSVAVDKGRT
jgi:hypothetical protein